MVIGGHFDVMEYEENLPPDISQHADPQGTITSANISMKQTRLCDYHKVQLDIINSKYCDLLAELFFLQHGGTYVDLVQFKKRPSQKLQDHLKQNPIVSSENDSQKVSCHKLTGNKDEENTPIVMNSSDQATSVQTYKQEHVNCLDSSNAEVKMSNFVLSAGGGNNGRLQRSSKNALSDVYEESIGSQEEILERAKQEAVVQRRVAELRKMGMWSQRRLPKVQEPPRNKAHWDYLLEEMRWLATDFAQERKWKRAAARKLVRMVSSYHRDSHERQKKAEREEQQKLRRIASNIARQVRIFWSDIEKVVQYKHRCLLDEKRQKALDLHLTYIVDQTAKYSDWLTQGLTQSTDASPSVSRTSSRIGSDDEFLPQGVSTDDEETIEVEENQEQGSVQEEINLLKEESKLPFADLLSQLPQDLVENIGKPLPELTESPPQNLDVVVSSTQGVTDSKTVLENDDSSDETSKPTPISLRRSALKRHADDCAENESKKKKLNPEEEDGTCDDEFDVNIEASDDEATMQEEEDEGGVDHEQELADLRAENDMPIEELMKLYGTSSSFNERAGTSQQETEEKKFADVTDSESEEESDYSASETEEIGMDYLMKNMEEKTPSKEPGEKTIEEKENSPNKEITDVAAEAMSLQPTGHTLATTQVVTPIPSLLRHTLREYQHIGLDWLVTMYDKRLNGILADEMGLGKTIQTIALLAHLACDKGVWGPHLIVVPTSVMLNWEMELKKWCPGFKILTYYGSQKERKLKRMGWTKANAFHVCITSYKLVLQDHTSFRRKKWRYLILDEAQNIKNFKSQRWQTLLNFNSQRRLLLTGTPLQNNLMELWSLMHFLMPHVFQSHKEFKEWFSNPLTGMIEGLQEYNEKLVRRLHKVLRPFLLRRIKKDVEKQMPNKYEHVVRCHLSKRQRFLYEDFMSKASTKETLAGGHFMSVINVLMQLRKVCNHPNLFEPRPTVSSFITSPLTITVPSLVHKALELDHFQEVDLRYLNLHLPSMSKLTSMESDALKRLKTPSKFIEEVDLTTDEPVLSPINTTDKMRSLIREKLVYWQQSNPRNIDAGQSQTDATLVPTTQSITLQYQTVQGTRWATIPNGQIRHLPGGVVQIVTSSVSSRSATTVPFCTATNDVNDEGKFAETSLSSMKGSSLKKIPAETYSRLLLRRKQAKRESTLSRLSRINDRRCATESPYLPSNTITFLQSIIPRLTHTVGSLYGSHSKKFNKGTIASSVLEDMLKSPNRRLSEMSTLLDRFAFVIPKVASTSVQCHVAHPTPWRYYSLQRSIQFLRDWFSCQLFPLHKIIQNTRVQFPETRLIEYDCGKLQVLNSLLRRFWEGKHRILIFTQMTKVLDILEAFLSYHGYRYLRLDGSTPIEQRMARMERFNNDPRIFCFILSTRSGGIGVNLTGADTVVFYDSDWNPTMDAQAQDRCHRIGQTRDVHIYRLISEKTVEENILKKANQKRLLGDLAIEGGGFTTAFFKQQAIKDLFDDPSGLEELTEPPRQLTARQKALEAAKMESKDSNESKDLEQALLESEEKEDAVAAEMLKQEQDAVLEEFDDTEEKQLQSQENNRFNIPKGSKVEEELRNIYDELNPVERYALHYLEDSAEANNDLELQEAEEQVEQSKKDWELAHLMALKEEEERRTEEADEIFYTREGNQMFMDDISGEPMPVWYPPTPPYDDMYIDPTICLLYETVPMPVEQFPVVAVKKERKRPKPDLSGVLGPHRKVSRVDISVPKSLFTRHVTSLKKVKLPKIKLPKIKPTVCGTPTKTQQLASTPTSSVKESIETVLLPSKSADVASCPEWIMNEDYALLQAVQKVLDMPLSLVTLMPAHTANWHLVADMVNAVGCVYRSAKQCKLRFESVIMTREEGKGESQPPKKNIKGNKLPSKLKHIKMQKTSLLYTADNNRQFSTLYSNRFDVCKVICSKRITPSKTSASNGQLQRNPNHTSMLQENGISYDNPVDPKDVGEKIAAKRTKRMANQKKSAGEQIFASSIQAPQVNTAANIQASANLSQHTLVVSGSPVVGKNALQVSTTGINPLTAIPLSGSSSSIVVNSAFTRRQPQVMQGAASKIQPGKTTGAALTLRTIPGTAQQFQIHQHSISPIQSMPLTFTAQSPAVTVTTAVPGASGVAGTRPVTTYSPRGGNKVSAFQHIRQASKQQTPQAVSIKQQIRVTQQHAQPLIGGANMSPSNSTLGKKVQLTKTRHVTPQQLEILMKQQRTQIKTVQQRSQVHIAPVQAQVQAQQIRSHAAQQASQQSSKPLPITVPVTNLSAVNLGVTTSSVQQKPVLVSGTPQVTSTLNSSQQLLLQQQLHKQRQLTQQRQQQQQSRQVINSKQQKSVYPSTPSHQLVVSGGGTTVKMSPQIQAQMINQIVAQQKQQQRSRINKGTSSMVQPPVTLTVTKLLQNSANPAIRHALVPQTAQLTQQATPLPLSVATTIVAPAGVVSQQQRMQPRQQLQLSRVTQLCQVTNCQPQSAIASTIVASAPTAVQRHSPVVTVSQVSVPQVNIQNLSTGSSSQLNLQMRTSQSSLLLSPHVSVVDTPVTTVEETVYNLHSMTR